MNEPAAVHERGGYPLSSLFLLIALFAVVSAHISPLLGAPLGSIQPEDPWKLALLCGICGGVLGVIVGLCHYRRLRGMMLGLLLGLTFGALCGPGLAVSVAFPQHTFLTSLVGAVVLLGIAACFRHINNTDPVSQRDAYDAKLREWQIPSPTEVPVEDEA